MTYSFTAVTSAANTGGATSIGLSVTYAAGDRAVVWARRGGTTADSEAVADGTNTYAQIGTTLLDATTSSTYVLFECKSTAAGTVTVTFSTALSHNFRAIAVARYASLDTSAAAQTSNRQVQAGPGTGANAISTTNMTPTSQPCVLVNFIYNDSAAHTPTAGTGFNSRGSLTTLDTAFGTASLVEDIRLTSTNPVAGTCTSGSGGGSDNYVSFGAVFTDTAAAAATLTSAILPSGLNAMGTGLTRAVLPSGLGNTG